MHIRFRLSGTTAFAFVFLLAFTEGVAQEPRLRWLETATVSRDHVYLADLLATGAGAQLRGLASRIDLGHAPEPGSFRVFTEDQLRKALGIFALNLPAQVTIFRQGYPISAQQLTRALMMAKLPQVLVTLLSEPQTRTADAAVRVTGTFPGPSPDLALIRFVCREPSDCGPFWGEIEVSKDWQLPPMHKPAPQPLRHAAALVTPGRLATLICDEPGMELRLRVRPLGRAGLGEGVRVYDPETRRIFLARVQAEDRLTSDLQEAR